MRVIRSLIIASAWIAAAAAARADDPAVEGFYRGRTVELYVGTTPGGGYDLYARVVGRYLGRHIPGNPTVVVKNMPGAGQLTMSNWLYKAAPRDGTVIAMAPQAAAIEQALKSDGIQYDAANFRYIGRVAPVVEVTYTWHTSPTKTLEDARKRETIMGASGPTSPTYYYLQALNQLAGTKFKIVNGFPGGGETNVAMERGEVEGNSKSWASMKVDNADWLRDKKVNILLQYSLERAPDLPDVPLMMELGRTEEARTALKVFAMGNAMGRSIFTAPGVPADRLAALRAAFDATMRDPELVAFTQEKHIDIGPPLDGAGLDRLVTETLAFPANVLATVKAAKGN
jgi:tripartite-type tricarboxylate transporter receptor subunit TctC